jgi:Nickel responsive protein SCO4226-like
MGEDIRWIRSYVVEEEDRSLGTICIYEGSSAEKVVEHASRAGLPADEVLKVLGTVLVRPDPA